MPLPVEWISRIKKTVPNTCSVLAGPVPARLLLSNLEGEWGETGIFGAVGFVQDRSLNTTFIRLWTLPDLEVAFQYELHENCDYAAPVPFLHTFEMDDCVAGLDFAEEEDAARFYRKVNQLKPTTTVTEHDPDSLGAGKLDRFVPQSMKASTKRRLTVMKGKFNRMFGPRKSHIGDVMIVKHDTHVGMGDEGFDVQNIPDEWKAMFKSAGVSKQDLRDPETAAAVMAALEEHKMVPEGSTEAAATKTGIPSPKARSAPVATIDEVKEDDGTEPQELAPEHPEAAAGDAGGAGAAEEAGVVAAAAAAGGVGAPAGGPAAGDGAAGAAPKKRAPPPPPPAKHKPAPSPVEPALPEPSLPEPVATVEAVETAAPAAPAAPEPVSDADAASAMGEAMAAIAAAEAGASTGVARSAAPSAAPSSPPKPQPAQPPKPRRKRRLKRAASIGRLATKPEDVDVGSYSRLVRLGMPREQVGLKFSAETGLPESVLFEKLAAAEAAAGGAAGAGDGGGEAASATAEPEAAAPEAAAPAAAAPPAGGNVDLRALVEGARDDPDLAKYAKLVSLGMPRDNVVVKFTAETGRPETDLFLHADPGSVVGGSGGGGAQSTPAPVAKPPTAPPQAAARPPMPPGGNSGLLAAIRGFDRSALVKPDESSSDEEEAGPGGAAGDLLASLRLAVAGRDRTTSEDAEGSDWTDSD